MAKSAAEQFKALKSIAKPKDKKPSSKQEMRSIDFSGTDHEDAIASLCELGFLSNQLEPLVEQHKDAVSDVFFKRWTQEMWESKTLPKNFKARIKKKDGVNYTTFDDLACNFILKFRDDGLKKKIPSQKDLEEMEKTSQEVIMETLMSGVVGLSEKNAHKFVAEEVVAIDKTDLPATLAELLSAEENSKNRAIGEFLLACLNAKTKKDFSQINPLTDEQRIAAIEIEEVIKLKDGVEERILSYVESLEQLRKLLQYMSVTKQVSNFEFGISDKVPERNHRLAGIVEQYIVQ